MSYSEYVPSNERPVLSMLVRLCLDGGNTVSVFDGEEYVLKRSSSINDIRSEMGGAGEDQLIVRDSGGEKIGMFYLIYNNGSEGEPMIVICDYSSNEFCEGIYKQLSDKYDA